MQALQANPSVSSGVVAAVSALGARFAAIRRRPRATGYEGCAWCDATERDVILDVATHRRFG